MFSSQVSLGTTYKMLAFRTRTESNTTHSTRVTRRPQRQHRQHQHERRQQQRDTPQLA